jgi:glycosyltransferase involved in cell wall biosynthesis
VTVVIPARNERGNIEAAVKRIPSFVKTLEILFVEGHSRDGTWEEIERVVAAPNDFANPPRHYQLKISINWKPEATALAWRRRPGCV